MDIYQLKQFVTLAQTGNMTETAQLLYISQPNISRSIKKLEEELGVQLFNRSRNKMILNPSGEYVLEHAKKALEEVEKIWNVKDALYPDNSLIISGVGTVYFDIMIPAVAPLFPQYNISTQVRKNWDELRTSVFNEKSDIIVMGDQEPLGPEVEVVFFFREKYCISVPFNHPFYDREHLSLQDLENQDFIISTHPEARFSNGLLKKHNITVNAVYTTDQPVSETKFYNIDALLFETSVARFSHTDIFTRKLIPLIDEDCGFNVYLTYKKDNQERCEPFVRALIEKFGESV